MKRFVALLLVGATILGLCGCGAASDVTQTTQAQSETAAVEKEPPASQEAVPETEALPLEGSLFLKVSSITFSLVGETEDIYLGVIPRELVTWQSEDPSVVSVEDGVLTAIGVGSTTIRATYDDREVTCQAGCLATTQEELSSLDAETLCKPKRLPPEVDLTAPCTYYDNSAILGDSITDLLWRYDSTNHSLGKMTFVTRYGISVQGLVLRFKNMYFQGHEMAIEDIAANLNADRIYLMLGCLDFQVPSATDQLEENWTLMLDRIEEKAPDTEIVIISNIPRSTQSTGPVEYNIAVQNITDFLRQLASERGYGFLDLGYYIQDHYGRMPAEYSKDKFHMNDEGSLVWTKLLRLYAQLETEKSNLAENESQK